MTTVVYSNNVIASDSLMTRGMSPHSGDTQKVYENNHLIVGFAGRVGMCLRIVDWLMEHNGDPEMKPDLSDFPSDAGIEFELIVIDKESKECWTYEGVALDAIPMAQPVAIGSGSYAAMGALAHMKFNKEPQDAKKAVKAGIACDIFSGGRIQAIDLNPKVKKPRIKKPK